MGRAVRLGLLAVVAGALSVSDAAAGMIAAFKIDAPREFPATGLTAKAELTEVANRSAGELDLFLVDGDKRTEVPFQIIDTAGRRTLYWLVSPDDGAAERRYELVDGNGSPDPGYMRVAEEGDRLIVKAGDRRLLGYQVGTMPAPEGTNPLFQRSAFIHPLWSPSGRVLTTIQPSDHYHHYGLWNPWTHVRFRGREVDFWNLAKGEGTVRFAGLVDTVSGPVVGGYTAKHEHVAFNADGSETVALNEHQTVRIHRSATGDAYIADLLIEMTCATDEPFHILEYRYAGLGWRGAAEWNDDNSRVLTSEGMTREDADGTNARWYMIQGDINGAPAGVAMLSHPENFNHPEPLRIWPPGTHEGAVFSMFAPTKTSDWVLEPGKTHVLRYRMLVFDGETDAAAADAAWEAFANPPKVQDG